MNDAVFDKLVQDVGIEKANRMKRKLDIILDESREWASIKRLEMKLDRRFDWRKLKKASLELGLRPRKVFDANYGQVNSYHASVWEAVYGIDLNEVA